MQWIFALGIIGFMIGSAGFRRVVFLGAGAFVALTIILMIVHKF